MAYVDFILNLAGLLLWLNWRSLWFDPLTRRTPATLLGTLRPAAPQNLRRWHLLLLIAGLLVLRAFFYWKIGTATGDTTSYLNLGLTAPGFRRDIFRQILAFSFLSFGLALGIFYVGLLLLSLLKGPDPVHRLVKILLGRVDGWPRWIKFLLPLLVTAVLWWLSSWLLGWLHISTPPVSGAHRIEQSLVIGLDSYLVWKFPLGALLVLHILASYIYFGKHPFWNYVKVTAQELLRPLKRIPLRLGRVDFAPVLAMALIFLAAELAGRGLNLLYMWLPF